ncbi:peptide chain release factor N(5)-glutamine methyltransferase [uncultured Muribaculum sp.]|uniref:peptide chain release factor N(5)-glutamine methyltransferase n=1 Tax=uncultured Muribaculum sp. TaxID=1918613 RepID=UPI0026091428|nr:peptide chain release factor N(5)-glutamine methyltransferase [uncultured Muribaculum sp.]
MAERILSERATVGELAARLRDTLSPRYGGGEAQAMARIIMEESLRLAPVDVALRRDDDVLPESLLRIDGIVARLLRGEPIQYIYGHTQWYGGELKVTPDVLIPRPETAQMIDMVVDEWGDKRDLRVMDLCTGSGCIAVTLARVLPFADVDGVDISERALAVARDNAVLQHVRVDFRLADVLSMTPPPTPSYDIITCNPPYIPDRDAAGMDANVLDYEPHMALFVPDDDPMKFYRPVASYAAKALLPGGMLYVELDPAGADGVARCMRDAGLSDVATLRDFAGCVRFATGRKE